MRNAVKTLGWLLISWIIIAVGVWWRTGDMNLAFISTIPGILLKTPFYSLYEFLWEGKSSKLAHDAEVIAEAFADMVDAEAHC